MAQESVVRGSLAGPQTGATTSFGSKFWPAPCSRETGAREVSIVAAGCFTSRAAAGQPRAACARTDLQTLNRRPTRSALCSRFSAPSRPRCTRWVRRPPFRLDPPGAVGLLPPPLSPSAGPLPASRGDSEGLGPCHAETASFSGPALPAGSKHRCLVVVCTRTAACRISPALRMQPWPRSF
jgi:hypothetical protein